MIDRNKHPSREEEKMSDVARAPRYRAGRSLGVFFIPSSQTQKSKAS
jgi:hypothetical protein